MNKKGLTGRPESPVNRLWQANYVGVPPPDHRTMPISEVAISTVDELSQEVHAFPASNRKLLFRSQAGEMPSRYSREEYSI